MKIWTVTREYAGISEAGGVKNVTCSLSENLVKQGHSVVLFIPFYGCTDISQIIGYSAEWHKPVSVLVQGVATEVCFSHGIRNGVEIVFVRHKAFAEKKAVYTYTKEEELLNPAHKKGHGHEDVLFLNTLFQKAVVQYGTICEKNEQPDIIHCHDAVAAMVPVFLTYACKKNNAVRSFFEGTKCVTTIHNAGCGYHHEYSSLAQAAELTGLPKNVLAKGNSKGKIEPYLLASSCSRLTTVSPQYAEEIMLRPHETDGLSDYFTEHKVCITGITNGIEWGRYNPSDTSVSLLPCAFNPIERDFAGKYGCRTVFLEKHASKNSLNRHLNKDVDQYGFIETVPEQNTVYIAYHGRVVEQKGISVLAKTARVLLEKHLPVKFIFIGQGDPVLEQELVSLTEDFPGDTVFFNGFDRALSRLCIASADFAVFPSRFEPCGTADFIAQIYGTLPLAHATGGLKKIVDEETGFLYEENTPETLAGVLYSIIRIVSQAGIAIFTSMMAFAARYTKTMYSWETVVREQYIPLYESLCGKEACQKKK